MEVKGVFLSFCLCLLVVTCTDAAFEKCCRTTVPFKQRWMKKLRGIRLQYSSGSCDINAGILRLKGLKNPACIDIEKAKEILGKFKKSDTVR